MTPANSLEYASYYQYVVHALSLHTCKEVVAQLQALEARHVP